MTRDSFLGVDVGGTFTDLVLFDLESGEIHLNKVPSTPPDFSTGVLSAVREALAGGDESRYRVTRFAHGTTVGTNAILESKGPKVGLLTTAGFRDVLEIGRQDRDNVYDLMFAPPRPLAPRNLRQTVVERTLSDGRILRPIDEKSAVAAIRRLVKAGVEAIAVSLLHSYANSAHEERIAELIERLAPKVTVSVSSAVLAEFREYERTATTVMNAYVMPLLARYLDRLSSAMSGAGIKTTIGVMQSNGGLLPASAAARLSVGALLSGPAAGVVGAVAVATNAGFSDVISFDMGGTSCDVSLIAGGEPRVTVGGRLGGYPIQLPMLDIHTVGAGGGSIGHVQGSALKVGPESAGAVPGPVCYGRGGLRPTVSDAHAVLGHLSAQRFLLGRGQLDVDAARRAIDSEVAQPLGMTVQEAALGILAVTNDRMMHAIRSVSVEKGYDPRPAVLVAFGGAGPLHACDVARLLGIKRVLIPLVPGALSALGLLLADTRRDLVKTWVRASEEIEPAEIESAFVALEADGREQLHAGGVEPDAIYFTRSADLRYRGQAFELMVSMPPKIGHQQLTQMVADFHDAHQRMYGHAAPAEPVELVNVRVQVWGRARKPEFRRLSHTPESGHLEDAVEFRDVGTPLGSVSVSVVDRALLRPGRRIRGPAIIEQSDSTAVIGEDDVLEVDDYGNLIVSISAA